MENIVITILAAGFVGGVWNFLRALQPMTETKEAPNPAQNSWLLFGYNLLSAEIAAFLTPLFLSLASSSLIAEAQTDWNKRLIFGGFCLVAASLSNRFTESVSQKVLAQIEDTKKLAHSADTRSKKNETKQKQLQAVLTEPDEPKTTRLNIVPEVRDDKMVVLNAVENSRYPFRSLSGISNDSHLTPEQAKPLLEKLTSEGKLATTTTDSGVRWYKSGGVIAEDESEDA